MVKGNHDAESLMSRDLDYPDTVKVFRSDEAETATIDEYRVALHGRSFPTRLTGEFVGRTRHAATVGSTSACYIHRSTERVGHCWLRAVHGR